MIKVTPNGDKKKLEGSLVSSPGQRQKKRGREGGGEERGSFFNKSKRHAKRKLKM
jgi:hypothetical protein